MTIEQLQTVKQRFGGLVRLDYTGLDLVTAHARLGQHVGAQARKILTQRLERSSASKIQKLLDQSRSCAATLIEKRHDQKIDRRVRNALIQYQNCLKAWAGGAGIDTFHHPHLDAYQPLTTLDLALFLQHDSSGCQTGMYRLTNGSVILWHTEEDVEFEPGSGFDLLRIASFNNMDDDHPVHMHAFIYPDLMPGPAFGWRSDGYVQAVDTLHTRDFDYIKNGMLANVVTWLSLLLGATIPAAELIESLQPYYDGYALNTVYPQGGAVLADKYEFASDRIIPCSLANTPASYLFQVNIFSDQTHPWVAELEEIRPDWRELYAQRMARTMQSLQNKDGHSGDTADMRFFFDMLTSQEGDGWAYANQDVKAYFIQHQDLHETETWLGDGPAIPGDRFTVLKSAPR